MSHLDRFKNLSVAIACPSMGVWEEQFGVSLQNLLIAFMNYQVGAYKTQRAQVMSTRGSSLSHKRFYAVRDALKTDADYLLWLDTDHKFPRKLLHVLLDDDKDVVGVNHVTKQIPANPTARQRPEPGTKHPLPVYTDPASPKLEKVWRLGCGTMLVKMGVFRKTGPAVFDVKYVPEIDDYQGEDWSMCEAFERAGFDIWVDHELSLECKHIGKYEFDHDVVGRVAQVNQQVAEAVKGAFEQQRRQAHG